MKDKLAQIASNNLLEKLVDQPYAFAAWRMPNAQDSQVAISLSDPLQDSSSLADLQPGFLFNRFSDNHPANPFHIKADLVFTNSEIKIDPRVSSNKVDIFIKTINEVIQSKKETSLLLTTKDSDYEHIVRSAVEKIREGAFDKVVLARYEDQQLPSTFSPAGFFKKICDTYAHSFCSMVHLPGEGIWIGASPETLISTTENTFKTISLAGTKKLSNGQSLGEIAWTQKEIEEQAFVSRYIINCFKKIRLREFREHGPKTVEAGSLAHLKTEFAVDLKETQFDGLADQMVGLLHPTSAVCGMPLDATKEFIATNEGFDREFYSGFLGPVNFNGSTDLFVNLRCMKVMGKTARFFAGAGITEDSNPSSEFLETQLKMSVLKSLI